ncbi:MAG: ribonuclease HI family protein [Snowella sp.]|nr:ribonuclease HI family protein [Snowella sp.]
MSNPNNQSPKGNVLPIMLFAGESRGEQGQGAAAAIILMPNGKRFTVSQLLSFTTTEEAEYHGLVIGLRKSLQLGIQSIEVKGNSETIFNQVNGLTDVQNDKSRILFREVIRLMRQFERASVEWISAEQNRSARNAVRRCIEEALGRDHPSPTTSRGSVSISEEVARLIQLGPQATDQDFLQIGKELDHFSLKTLTELRPLVPIAIQDVIALKWTGDEEELAQMYRWYLRGLPPDMAIRRVALERQSYESPTSERLPWEGQLLGSRDTLPNDPQLQEDAYLPFISLGENIDMGSIEMRSTELKNPPPQNSASSSAIVSPVDTLESVFTLSNEVDNLPAMSLFSPMTEATDPFSTLGSVNAEAPSRTGDHSRDTLPSGDRVQQAISLLLHFSEEEKAVFMYELIQIPELATQVLNAIAAKLKRT